MTLSENEAATAYIQNCDTPIFNFLGALRCVYV